jgi:hypothetical protein
MSSTLWRRSAGSFAAKVAFLRKLGVVERRFRRLEVGAAVLAVGIEEERVEAAI